MIGYFLLLGLLYFYARAQTCSGGEQCTGDTSVPCDVQFTTEAYTGACSAGTCFTFGLACGQACAGDDEGGVCTCDEGLPVCGCDVAGLLFPCQTPPTPFPTPEPTPGTPSPTPGDLCAAFDNPGCAVPGQACETGALIGFCDGDAFFGFDCTYMDGNRGGELRTCTTTTACSEPGQLCDCGVERCRCGGDNSVSTTCFEDAPTPPPTPFPTPPTAPPTPAPVFTSTCPANPMCTGIDETQPCSVQFVAAECTFVGCAYFDANGEPVPCGPCGDATLGNVCTCAAPVPDVCGCTDPNGTGTTHECIDVTTPAPTPVPPTPAPTPQPPVMCAEANLCPGNTTLPCAVRQAQGECSQATALCNYFDASGALVGCTPEETCQFESQPCQCAGIQVCGCTLFVGEQFRSPTTQECAVIPPTPIPITAPPTPAPPTPSPTPAPPTPAPTPAICTEQLCDGNPDQRCAAQLTGVEGICDDGACRVFDYSYGTSVLCPGSHTGNICAEPANVDSPCVCEASFECACIDSLDRFFTCGFTNPFDDSEPEDCTDLACPVDATRRCTFNTDEAARGVCGNGGCGVTDLSTGQTVLCSQDPNIGVDCLADGTDGVECVCSIQPGCGCLSDDGDFYSCFVPRPAPTPEPAPTPFATFPPTPAPTPLCTDFEGNLNVRDECGVCGGLNECLDCCGVFLGGAMIDECGVCEGLNECLDCAGEPNGSAREDKCGVCNGNNDCVECVAPDVRDECGICRGDNTTCADCAGVPNGSSVISTCGVCGGTEADCVDCEGRDLSSLRSFGIEPSVVDTCDVCNGDGTSCLDCAGVANGPALYDLCDVCGGSDDCLDCAGVPFGVSCYDACDVCDGDDSSCTDCAGVLHGTSARDRCGICDGPDLDNCHERAIADAIDQTDTWGAVLLYIVLATAGVCVLCLVLGFLCFGRFQTRTDRRRRVTSGSRKILVTSVVAAMAAPAWGQLAVLSDLCTAGVVTESFFCSDLSGFCANQDNTFVGCAADQSIRALTLRGTNNARVPLTVLQASAPTLSVLFVRDLQLELTADVVCRMHALRSLVLYNVTLVGLGSADALNIDWGECTPRLEVLQLDHVPQAQLRLDNALYRAAASLRVLRFVHVHSVAGDLSDFTVLPSLQRFEIQNAKWTPNEFPLRFRRRVTSIRLDGNPLNHNLDNGPFIDLEDAGGGLVDLSEFSASNAGISGASADNLVTRFGASFLVATPAFQLVRLREFRIANNRIGGAFPEGLCEALDLDILDVAHNELSMSLPDCLLAVGPLSFACFDDNDFVAPVPEFSEDNLCGECSFRGNRLCVLPTSVADLGCDFGDLLPDVCDGGCGDLSCFDCQGHVNGSAVYDVCDVCGGDGTSCLDCMGVANGVACYDECDVCEGDSSRCADCAGVPNGLSRLDRCGVCGGDGKACLDCDGAFHGTSAVDACGVCNGDGTACLDCDGVLNGTSVPDECGVCNGDGLSCAPKLKQQLHAARSNGAIARWWSLVIGTVVGSFVVCLLIAICLFCAVRGRR